MIWLKPSPTSKVQEGRIKLRPEDEFNACQVAEKLNPTPPMYVRDYKEALKKFREEAKKEQERIQRAENPVQGAHEILKIEDAVIISRQMDERLDEIHG